MYVSQHEIPEGYDEASGCQVYLYFHERTYCVPSVVLGLRLSSHLLLDPHPLSLPENDAWAVSHALNSLDVLAYAASHIKNIWSVSNGKGAFIPDPTVKLVAASNGQVLTRLGPWYVEPDGEVALKKESEGTTHSALCGRPHKLRRRSKSSMNPAQAPVASAP